MNEIKTINIGDKEYPKRLLKINNPPKKLYVRGDYKLLNSDSIAIVGARKCSEYGMEQSYKFAYELSTQRMCIVSGLAVGIDKFAHLGAYKNEGKTIAVLGCGINKMYPKENLELSEEILKNGGCIISECDINEDANLKKFPKRNRIITGIAMGTLVVEAGSNRSGILVTARLSHEQEKPVFCIPGDLGRSTSLGTNLLIKNYGIFTTRVEDIFNELNIEYDSEKLEKNRITSKKKYKYIKECYNEQKNTHNKKNTEKSKVPECKKIVSKEYAPVYKVLENVPLSINEIYLKSGISIKEVNQILTMLELEGFVKQEPGNRFSLV